MPYCHRLGSREEAVSSSERGEYQGMAGTIYGNVLETPASLIRDWKETWYLTFECPYRVPWIKEDVPLIK